MVLHRLPNAFSKALKAAAKPLAHGLTDTVSSYIHFIQSRRPKPAGGSSDGGWMDKLSTAGVKWTERKQTHTHAAFQTSKARLRCGKKGIQKGTVIVFSDVS